MSKLSGEDIIYHYIQKYLPEKDEILANKLIENMLSDLSIWIPIEVYEKIPIILPYVVRDSNCRKIVGGVEAWGSANENGFFRDDNSLIKGIIRSFQINSNKIREYNNKKIKIAFTASHIWRIINNNENATGNYKYNSFIPNLVWLPKQVAKLTDREGSYAQKFLQHLSIQIYKDVKMPYEIKELWNSLPYPDEFKNHKVELGNLNFFKIDNKWTEHRISGLKSEIQKILSLGDRYNQSLGKIKSRRYLPTLTEIPLKDRNKLKEWLQTYRNILENN